MTAPAPLTAAPEARAEPARAEPLLHAEPSPRAEPPLRAESLLRTEPPRAAPRPPEPVAAERPGAAPEPEALPAVAIGDFATGDDDAVGLLAFALAEQNRRDWLAAYAARRGGAPDARAVEAWLLGERAPRRLKNYRRLAEAAVERHARAALGLVPAGTLPPGFALADAPPAKPRRRRGGGVVMALYLLLVAGLVAGAYYALEAVAPGLVGDLATSATAPGASPATAPPGAPAPNPAAPAR